MKSFQNIFEEKKTRKKKIPKLETQRIIVDFRERNSLVPTELIAKGVKIKFKQLKIGDYVIGKTIIERKTFSDLISSMINKRIFKQAEELKKFNQRLIIIENYDLENLSRIHENALRGLILSLTLKYNLPIIFTKNSNETAKYLELIARKKEKEISLNTLRKNLTKKEQLQFVVEAFPNVGPKKAKALLKKFSSLKNLFNSKTEELEKILGKRAKEFKETIERNYNKTR